MHARHACGGRRTVGLGKPSDTSPKLKRLPSRKQKIGLFFLSSLSSFGQHFKDIGGPTAKEA